MKQKIFGYSLFCVAVLGSTPAFASRFMAKLGLSSKPAVSRPLMASAPAFRSSARATPVIPKYLSSAPAALYSSGAAYKPSVGINRVAPVYSSAQRYIAPAVSAPAQYPPTYVGQANGVTRYTPYTSGSSSTSAVKPMTGPVRPLALARNASEVQAYHSSQSAKQFLGTPVGNALANSAQQWAAVGARSGGSSRSSSGSGPSFFPVRQQASVSSSSGTSYGNPNTTTVPGTISPTLTFSERDFGHMTQSVSGSDVSSVRSHSLAQAANPSPQRFAYPPNASAHLIFAQ